MYSAIKFSARGGRMAVVVVATMAGVSLGQSKTETAPRRAEVTATDVYVRSGPSSNHYPVIKLGAGDRITVVGQNREWYEILPPAGTFSFISGDFVDTADNKTGVVSGNNVRVRAGSVLPEFAKNKYVVQTKLSRGAEVSILGRDPDGYLRIKPPEGVTVWVHNGYVAILPGAGKPVSQSVAQPVAATVPPKSDAVADGSLPNEAPTSATEAVAAASPKSAAAWTFRGLPETEQRRTLAEIDDLVRAEMEKPVIDREFTTMGSRYEPVAEQTEDEFASRYATARLRQLAQMSSAIGALRSSRLRDEELQTLRRGFVDERARIREELPPIPSGLDAQGVLRTSALYPVGSFPQRYRLTDPTSKRDRTLAYVEVRPNAGIDVASFLDRYVGVRATGKRLQTGGIQPVPIYMVDEIVLLEDEPAASDSPDEG
ncbi:MAG: hypothetical protein IH989_00075 [Planctomycetes bacterium]|nr:hypothetical protein [Planctomycetota bacterium]